ALRAHVGRLVGAGVQAAAPAVEVAEHLVRLAAADQRAAVGDAVDMEGLVPVELLGALEAVAGQVADLLDAHGDAGGAVAAGGARHRAELDDRRQRRDAHVAPALRHAPALEPLVRRVPDADARIDAADLDRAQLRVLERPPRLEHAALVLLAIPP